MPDDWYRNTKWDPDTAQRFWDRLGRSRTDYNKAQYLKVQAVELADAGEAEGALEIVDHLLEHFPEPRELPTAYHVRARALLALERESEAIDSFRNSLRAEQELRYIHTGAALDFAEHVALKRRQVHYEEVEKELHDFVERGSMLFPVQKFRVLAITALIEDDRGNHQRARELAYSATELASIEHSGLRYHPKIGLVADANRALLDAVTKLVAF